MKYERTQPGSVSIEDVLVACLEYMEDRQDADHDGESFVPNEEMKLAVDIGQALYQLENDENNLRTKLLECARNLGNPAYEHSYATREMIDKLREDTLNFLGV
jgi:hypothetical protein